MLITIDKTTIYTIFKIRTKLGVFLNVVKKGRLGLLNYEKLTLPNLPCNVNGKHVIWCKNRWIMEKNLQKKME